MILGYDVSSLQGEIDWQKEAAAGCQFAYIRAGIGNDTPDRLTRTNVQQAQAASLKVGVYHFLYPLDHIDPIDSVKQFLALTDGLSLDLPVALDLEWPDPTHWGKWHCTDASIRLWGLAACQAVQNLTGQAPIVYTYPWFAKTVRLMGYDSYLLWIADYASYNGLRPPDGAKPTQIPPWQDWAVWQHSGGGMRLVSNGAPVDADVINPTGPLAQYFLPSGAGKTYTEAAGKPLN